MSKNGILRSALSDSAIETYPTLASRPSRGALKNTGGIINAGFDITWWSAKSDKQKNPQHSTFAPDSSC